MDKLKTPTALLQQASGCLTVSDPGTIQSKEIALAVERTALLFGCYRKGDANDPDIYTAAVAAVLAEWSPEIIREVTDPRTGLARRCQWLPTIAEVYAACEAADAPRRRAEERAELMKRAYPALPAGYTGPRESLAELEARHGGKNFGLNPQSVKDRVE